MKENQRVLAFGLSSCGNKNFDGDAVLLVGLCDGQKNAKILHEGVEYQIHKKQLEEIKFLYPNEIYVRDSSLDDVNSSDKVYFKWWIWELISRNHALTENEITWVQNYFSQKWLGGKKSIRYDIIETNIKEFKDF